MNQSLSFNSTDTRIIDRSLPCLVWTCNRPELWLTSLITNTRQLKLIELIAMPSILVYFWRYSYPGTTITNYSPVQEMMDVTVRCRPQIVYRVTLGNLGGAHTWYATSIYKALKPHSLFVAITWVIYYYGVFVVVVLVRVFDWKSEEVLWPLSWLLPIIRHTYLTDSGWLICLYESWIQPFLFRQPHHGHCTQGPLRATKTSQAWENW